MSIYKDSVNVKKITKDKKRNQKQAAIRAEHERKHKASCWNCDFFKVSGCGKEAINESGKCANYQLMDH
jgi:sulfatase maturation enzyme AslB (radical SAM superfamily)